MKILLFILALLISAPAWAQDSKLSALPALTSPTSDDILYIVDDPSGAPAPRKITFGNLTSTLAPSNAHYLTTQAETGLSAESSLGAGSTGIVRCAVSGSVCTPSTAELSGDITTSGSNA